MAGTTRARQSEVLRSDIVDDTKSPGSTLVTASVTIQDGLNSIRSQLKRILEILNLDPGALWTDDTTFSTGDVINGIMVTEYDQYGVEFPNGPQVVVDIDGNVVFSSVAEGDYS